MSKLITCPFHDDRTASMKVYGDFAFCFACHLQVPVSELNLPAKLNHSRPEPTNILERLDYIKSLPVKSIRGLELPADGEGYYILWPGNKFYKKRLYQGKIRYLAPTGHKPPLYICPGDSEHLLVVEGELNAASIYPLVWDTFKVVSPGTAGDFMRHIAYYLKYKRITIIADYDPAGICHGLQLKETLLRHGKRVEIILTDQDLNDKLITGKLEEFVKRNL